MATFKVRYSEDKCANKSQSFQEFVGGGGGNSTELHMPVGGVIHFSNDCLGAHWVEELHTGWCMVPFWIAEPSWIIITVLLRFDSIAEVSVVDGFETFLNATIAQLCLSNAHSGGGGGLGSPRGCLGPAGGGPGGLAD